MKINDLFQLILKAETDPVLQNALTDLSDQIKRYNDDDTYLTDRISELGNQINALRKENDQLEQENDRFRHAGGVYPSDDINRFIVDKLRLVFQNNPTLCDQVVASIGHSNKVYGIKFLRAFTMDTITGINQLGLKESKDRVEELMRQYPAAKSPDILSCSRDDYSDPDVNSGHLGV